MLVVIELKEAGQFPELIARPDVDLRLKSPRPTRSVPSNSSCTAP